METILGQNDSDSVRDNFLGAMRRMAQTVCVLTHRDEHGDHHGMAASSVTSLSLEPLSIIACVHRSAEFHQYLTLASTFCVNILSDDQSAVSRVFGSPAERAQRFKIGTWSEEPSGAPMLAGAQANLICNLDKTVDYGTHTIAIAQVNKVYLGGKVAPLIYMNRDYVSAGHSV